MRKNRWLALLPALLLLLGSTFRAEAQPVKYWVFLADKADALGKTQAVEPDYLTEKAEARRALRATRIPALIDTPLSPLHLDALRKAGIEPLVQSRWLNAVSAYLTPGQVAELSAQPFVRAIQPVASQIPATRALAPETPQPIHPLATSLEYGPSQPQLDLVNVTPLLDAGMSGAGVTLGIIDTGMGDLASFPALAQMVAENRITTMDFTGQPDDGSRHGLSVLSVAAGYDEGQLIGPAWGATVLAARTEYTPTETNQEEDHFVAGLEWMEAQGADVVNSSLGYFEFDAGQQSYTYADMDGNTTIVAQAVDRAIALGMVVVTSAGNWACGSPQDCWYYISTPADADSVISVGGVTASGAKASFSSFGPSSDGQLKPEVSALAVGVYLMASNGTYSTSNGTSFSSPMVAGIAALMLEAHPRLTPMQLREALIMTASQQEDPDNGIGNGIVDAVAALDYAATLVSTAPAEQPVQSTLLTAFPNPFSDRLTLHIQTPLAASGGIVRLALYDLLGREVAVWHEGLVTGGSLTVRAQTASLTPGLYVYRLVSPQGVETGTVVKAR